VNTKDKLGRIPLHGILDENVVLSRVEKVLEYSQLYNKRRALVMLIRAGADTTARAIPPVALWGQPMGWIIRGELQSPCITYYFGPDGNDFWEDEECKEEIGDTPLYMAC
jgi:hypothetical protein